MGCDYCKKVLDGVSIRHTVLTCPYRRSMYCYICASYGHIVGDCPNKRAKAIREGKSVKGIVNLTLEVPSTKEGMHTFLFEKGLIEKSSTYVLDSKVRGLLRDYSNSMNPPRLLVFV